MLSPFPGMDPYLEAYWGNVRPMMLKYICDEINHHSSNMNLYTQIVSFAILRETYDNNGAHYPDLLSTEKVVVISNLSETREPIAVIHVFDKSHKNPDRTKALYYHERKMYEVRHISLIEIDLLRAGAPLINVSRPRQTFCYQAYARRGWWPQLQIVYRMPINERLRKIEIPLRENNLKVHLDLQIIIDRCYSSGGYGSIINYKSDAAPPLSGEDARWADKLLKDKGYR